MLLVFNSRGRSCFRGVVIGLIVFIQVTLSQIAACAAEIGLAEWSIETPGKNLIADSDLLEERGVCLCRPTQAGGTLDDEAVCVSHIQWWTYSENHVVGRAEKGLFIFDERSREVQYFASQAKLESGMKELKLEKPRSARLTPKDGWNIGVGSVLVDAYQQRLKELEAGSSATSNLGAAERDLMKKSIEQALTTLQVQVAATTRKLEGGQNESPAAHTESIPRPNVVIIFIDDMGYGDVGFNGATVPKTPHLDRMAKEGMKFTDFYVGCAVCSGSRTALLTGCHYQRLSMSPVLFPNSKQGLHPDEVTIADMLKDAGYRTACIGKWHLGHLPPCLPTFQGFDSYWGVPYSNDMWLDPANKLAEDIRLRAGLTRQQVEAGHKVRNQVPIFRDEEVIEYPADQATLTKRYTEEAIRFITRKSDKPFFLYLPHTMVHRPLAVSEAFDNPEKSLITNAIEEVDWSVGQILESLRNNGIADETLVVFTSDNGAAVGSSLPLRAKKGSVYDGGIREPTVMWWPGRIPAGSVCREVAASIDLLPTIGQLCGGEIPNRTIDGKSIWPLMSGEDGARSPHEVYVLMHGPGTVRSGKWKFYPWQEGKGKGDWSRAKPSRELSTFPVQLYDTVADIGETTNVAATNPDVVQRLQAAYDLHVSEITAHQRPTAELQRPADAPSAERPDPRKRKQAQGSK